MKEILAKLAHLVQWFRFHILCLFKLELWFKGKEQGENINQEDPINDKRI